MKQMFPRWLAVTLVTSLGLNLFFAGMFFSRHNFGEPAWNNSRHGHKKRIRKHRLVRLMRQAPELVDTEQRPALEALLDKRQQTIYEQIKKLRASRRQLRTQLTAEKLDKKTLSATLEQLQNQSQAARTAVHGMVLEVAENLDDKQRRALFSQMRSGRRGGGRRFSER